MPELSIALVGPSWPFRGGISSTTTELARALLARRQLVRFCSPVRQYPRWLFPGVTDVDENATTRIAEAERCFSVFEPWTYPKLLRSLASAKPDAIILPYWTQAWTPLWIAIAAARIAPIVAIVHNDSDHERGALATKMASLTLGRARGYFCHAESVATEIRRRFPNRPLGIHPLPLISPRAGADRAKVRERLGLAADEVAFLYFGVIRPYKGVDILLRAFADLPASVRAKLLVAGELWAKDTAIVDGLHDPRVKDRVVAKLEWIDDVEADAWFAAADVAVLPYRSATGSAVLSRALGAGLPIVATAVGGLSDLVHTDSNGILVPPEDPAALTAALARMLDPVLRKRLRSGEAAIGTWDDYAAGVEAVIAQVLAAR